MIKENFDIDKIVSFNLVSPDTIFEEIVSVDTINLHVATMYQPKFVKANAVLFSNFVSNAFNKSCHFFFYHLENS